MASNTKSGIEPGMPVRYDSTTIALHWLTVVLVVVLFALAETWGFLPRGTPLEKQFQSLHISLGIVLALVIAARLTVARRRARQALARSGQRCAGVGREGDGLRALSAAGRANRAGLRVALGAGRSLCSSSDFFRCSSRQSGRPPWITHRQSS